MAVNGSEAIATLKEFIVEHINSLDSVDQVEDESLLADLGLDSMSALNLLLDIEEEFEVEFPQEYLTAEVFSTTVSLHAAITSLS